MRRVLAFVALAAAAGAGLVLLTAWYLWSYQPQGGSVSGMMGQMMGSNPGILSPMPGSVWGSLVVLVIVVSIGFAGVAYYLAYPEIVTQETGAGKEAPGQAEPEQVPGMSWSVLVRTSRPEEKRVLEILAAHDGRYLQKFIVKESGLSKLKTHRILSRFAERGIVLAEKRGNTNEVSLAPWLHPKAPGLTVSPAANDVSPRG